MHTLHTLHSVVAVFDVCVRLRNIALHCTRPAQVDTNSEALERTSAASKDNTDAVKDLGEDIETVQEQLRKVAKDVYVSGCRASANTQRAMRNARCTCNHSKCNTHTHTRTRTHTHTHARARHVNPNLVGCIRVCTRRVMHVCLLAVALAHCLCGAAHGATCTAGCSNVVD